MFENLFDKHRPGSNPPAPGNRPAPPPSPPAPRKHMVVKATIIDPGPEPPPPPPPSLPRKQHKLVAAGVLVITRDDNDDKQHKFNITLHNEDDRLCS